jgi:SAM-dependent methyltransferase
MRPRIYSELADWWPLFTAPVDYDEEAAAFETILRGLPSPPRTILELGCGGGNVATWLKKSYTLTLTDISPEMLAVSAQQNPECEHILGDMRTLRLGRTFDVVFVHDAVMYLTTESDLRQCIATAVAHCRPGGATLFAPDWTRENMRLGTDTGGHDGTDGRALRYLEWITDPDPNDTVFTTDYVFVLHERDGSVRSVLDRHTVGVFPQATWLRLFADAGFRARALADPSEPLRTMFVAER